jgi:hypothetical protein
MTPGVLPFVSSDTPSGINPRPKDRPTGVRGAGRYRAHRPAPAGPAGAGHASHDHATDERARPPRPRRRTRRDGQSAARAPVHRAAWGDRALPRYRLGALAFLTRFPTQAKVDWLSPQRLETWLRCHRYPNPRRAELLHAHLADAARGTTGPEADARAHITAALVAGLQAFRTQIAALENDIQQLAAHPDGRIFTSLPKAGTVRAARLLAELGDCRSRFPTAQAWISLAGAAPSTRRSGKVTVVAFRWAVDKQLRGAVMDFAGDSHHADAWAADLYWKARKRGKDHSHATRILARARLLVIWRCWQNREAYDPDRHRAHQAHQNAVA